MGTGSDDKRRKPERPEDVEFAPDAWERFTHTVRRMAETPPKPRKADGDQTSDARSRKPAPLPQSYGKHRR